MTTKVMFFPNGVTAAFQDGEQVNDLQEPWFMLYVGMIAAYGINPCNVEFTMPDGSHARVFEIPQEHGGGYNWERC